MSLIRSLSSACASSSRHRIAVAMSGGVDSSVAAHLLSQQDGISSDTMILGIHMSNWDYHGDDDESSENKKCWEQDWKDAKNVAQHLQIPIVHTSFEAEYWNDVFEPYCQQLAKSITPNPDVDCNRYIKFGVLKEYIRKRFQIDTLATGHYARVCWDVTNNSPYESNDRMPLYLQQALEEDSSLSQLLDFSQPILMAARDASKDQSYFLTGVRGEALRNVLFPLGDLYKQPPRDNNNEEAYQSPQASLSVREIAEQAQLPTAQKRDSMGICFVGKRKHGSFVNEYIPQASIATKQQKGKCVNVEDGSIVTTFDPSKHVSLLYATIGQGAKISGASQKWFVVDKPDPMTVLICPGTHHPALYADRLYVQTMNWIAGHPPPSLPLRAQCRIRHLQPLVDCEIRAAPYNNGFEIVLQQPLRGIAPGQVCGIYYNDLICLGGGAISQRGPTYLDMQKDLPAALHPSGHNDVLATRRK